MPDETTPLPDFLVKQLDRLRKRLAALALVNGIGVALIVTCVIIAGVILLDLLTELSPPVRIGVLCFVSVTALLVLLRNGVLPATRRYRQSELAAIVEAAHPELRERLLSVVEFSEEGIREEESGSPLMRQMLIQQTVAFAESHDFTASVEGRRTIRNCRIAGIALLVLLFPFLFATQAYATLLTRFFNPWGEEEPVRNLILTIDHPDRVVGRGDDVEILVHPSWRFQNGIFPSFATLTWEHHSDGSPTGERQSRRMEWNENSQTYSVLLPRVMAGFHYSASALHSRTVPHRIDVVDRPNLTGVAVEVIPPDYTGLPTERHDPFVGEVVAVEQSELELQLSFDKPVASAEILWLDGSVPGGQNAVRVTDTVNGVPVRFSTPLPISEEGTSSISKLIAAMDQPSGRFVIRLRDEHDLTARQEPIRRLTASPDAAPRIEFVDLPQSTEARPNDIVRLSVIASDDYGLAGVELHGEWLKNGTRESVVIPVPEDRLGSVSFRYQFELDLTPLGLVPGAPLTIRARATDERPVPKPNETWTGIHSFQIRVDAKAAGAERLEERHHRTNQVLNQLNTELEKLRQSARKMQYQTQQADPAKNKEPASDQQVEELTEQIQKLSEQLEKLSAVMEQQPVFEHLAEKAKQIGEKSLASAQEKADAAKLADSSGKQKALSEAADDLQKAGKDLKSLQEEFQQIAKMQQDLLDLNRIADQVEKLANNVDALNSRRVENPRDIEARHQWQEDHRQLVAQHRTLEDNLETVVAKNPGLMDKARESLQLRMVALAEQAERLARQQQAVTRSNEQDNNSPAVTERDSDKTPGETTTPEPALVLLDYQDELLRQGRLLSSEIRQLGLKEQELNRKASAIPDAIRQATEALQQLDFPKAFDHASAATEKGNQLVEAMNSPDGSGLPERLQQRAIELAETQRQLTGLIQKLADSPQQQQQFRGEMQTRIQQRTEALTDELKQRSSDFKLDRINRPAQGDLAAQASEKSSQAQHAIEQSVLQRQDGDHAASKESSGKALESLRRAGHLSRQASEGANPNRAPETEIPGEVGRQVAESSQRLNQAGELLSQLQDLVQKSKTSEANQKQQNAESSNQEGEEKPSENSSQQSQQQSQQQSSEDGKGERSSQSQSGQSPPGQSQSGQGESSVTSSTLREAAQGLRLAAMQMGISQQRDQDQNSQQQSGQEAEQAVSEDATNSAFTGETHLQELERSLFKGSERAWGKLPGTLQTEMIESSRPLRDPTYQGLIRRYFE
ncbi:MAG TPA: hypothetical protein VNQ76_04675, partial [Planctomicrobium sp.]|nr:hypothetical protein [Planctomicrobium sp.]